MSYTATQIAGSAEMVFSAWRLIREDTVPATIRNRPQSHCAPDTESEGPAKDGPSR